jgi:hypothetical protein
MALEIKRDIVFQIFLCVSMLMSSQSTDTDIFCLKSIKYSLENPNNYLQNWNFNNKTEGFLCEFKGVECWHLSGPVPMFERGVFPNYTNNHKLCGGMSLAPCSVGKFHQALKGVLIVGFALSFACYIVVTYCISYSSVAPHKQLEKKKKNRNSRQNKDKELGKYIYSITSKTTQRIANYMHELLHPQLVEKGSKEVLFLSIFLNKVLY